jgi:hypothetical protein
MALRAAYDVGIHIPQKTIQGIIKWVKSCARSDGSIRYTPGGEGGIALTGGGVGALINWGEKQNKTTIAGLECILKSISSGNVDPYTQFYITQATIQAGGKYWQFWYPKIREALEGSQNSDGSWIDANRPGVGGSFGPAYATAMACTVLQVARCHLSIYRTH